LVAIACVSNNGKSAYSSKSHAWAPAVHVTVPAVTSADAAIAPRRGLPRASDLAPSSVPPSVRRVRGSAASSGELSTEELWEVAILASSACRKVVDPSYISDGVPARAGVPLRAEGAARYKGRTLAAVLLEKVGGTLVHRGVLLGGPNSTAGGLYIDVICADSGYGRPLLATVLAAVQSGAAGLPAAVRHPRMIASLSALVEVLLYYPRLGFDYRGTCNEEPLALPPALKARLDTRVKDKTLPTSFTAFFKDKDTKQLIEALQAEGLNVKKSGKCRSKKLSADEVFESECDINGFSMVLCKDAVTAPAAKPLPASPARKPASPARKPASPARKPARKPASPARKPARKPAPTPSRPTSASSKQTAASAASRASASVWRRRSLRLKAVKRRATLRRGRAA